MLLHVLFLLQSGLVKVVQRSRDVRASVQLDLRVGVHVGLFGISGLSGLVLFPLVQAAEDFFLRFALEHLGGGLESLGHVDCVGVGLVNLLLLLEFLLVEEGHLVLDELFLGAVLLALLARVDLGRKLALLILSVESATTLEALLLHLLSCFFNSFEVLVVTAEKAGGNIHEVRVWLVGLLGFLDIALADHGTVVEIGLHQFVVRLREVLDAGLNASVRVFIERVIMLHGTRALIKFLLLFHLKVFELLLCDHFDNSGSAKTCILVSCGQVTYQLRRLR